METIKYHIIHNVHAYSHLLLINIYKLTENHKIKVVYIEHMRTLDTSEQERAILITISASGYNYDTVAQYHVFLY